MSRHTATYRMHKVLVILRSGERFEDRFLERTGSRMIRFNSGRKVHVRDILRFCPIQGDADGNRRHKLERR